MKQTELRPIFCKHIPDVIEPGLLYITEEFKVSVHLCACGCMVKTVLPFNTDGEWTMVNNNGSVSFHPSIGNFIGESPYHAHYYIKENKIIWC